MEFIFHGQTYTLDRVEIPATYNFILKDAAGADMHEWPLSTDGSIEAVAKAVEWLCDNPPVDP
jgi:hypothetical protein